VRSDRGLREALFDVDIAARRHAFQRCVDGSCTECAAQPGDIACAVCHEAIDDLLVEPAVGRRSRGQRDRLARLGRQAAGYRQGVNLGKRGHVVLRDPLCQLDHPAR